MHRSKKRIYFPKGNRPKALVAINGNILCGDIVDKSDEGLGIEFHSREAIREESKGRSLQVFVNDADESCRINEMVIKTIIEGDNQKPLRLGFKAETRESREQFDKIFEKLRADENSETLAFNYQEDRIPRIDIDGPNSKQSIKNRLDWLEKSGRSNLDHIVNNNLDPMSLIGNIENYVGAVQVPIGIAGPIKVNGEHVNELVPIPMATTEGALVASASRGALVCNLSGGINTHVIDQTMLRAPVFFFNSIIESTKFVSWVKNQQSSIAKMAESVSSIAKLKSIDPVLMGGVVHLKFYYSTGDAAGQNMTTACTQFAAKWIIDKIAAFPDIKLRHFMIEGQFSGDKKTNIQNFTHGRGLSVISECLIDRDILGKMMRTTPELIVELWDAAKSAGMAIGMVGSNINFSNMLAGIFTATGQDIASVHESSMGILTMKIKNDGLYVSAYLPSLVIGTVGGGTSIPAQKECLELMDCHGQGKVRRLGELIAASCLALDLSTICALAANEFSNAHKRFGRNRPKNSFKLSGLNATNLTEFCEDRKILAINSKNFCGKSGITSNIVSRKSSSSSPKDTINVKSKGIFRLNIDYQNKNNIENTNVIFKIKEPSSHLIKLSLNLARLSGEDNLPGLYKAHSGIFGFNGSHLREIELHKDLAKKVPNLVPEYWGSIIDPSRDLYGLIMEDLSSYRLMDSVDKLELWNDREIKTCLDGMAELHAYFLNKPELINSPNTYMLNVKKLSEAKTFLEGLNEYVINRFPEITSNFGGRIANKMIELPSMAIEIANYHNTLNHGDFNPRNLCIKDSDQGPHLCLYDWELASFTNPQRDLVEFLAFVIKSEDSNLWNQYISYYYGRLTELSKVKLDRQSFDKVLIYNAYLYAMTRLNLYYLAHNYTRFTFLDRVYKSLSTFIENMENSSKPNDRAA